MTLLHHSAAEQQFEALNGRFAGDGESLVDLGGRVKGGKLRTLLWLGVICCNIGIVHHCQRDRNI